MTDNSFEREQWEKEQEFRKREVEVKESEAATKNRELAVKEQEAGIKDREQRLKNRELRLRIIELRKSRFTNPVFLGIIGATVAAAGTAIGAGIVAWSQIELEKERSAAQQEIERFKADSTLILEVVKTSDEAKARQNLKFLVTTRLITNETRRRQLEDRLANPEPVATLPANTPDFLATPGLNVTCAITQDVNVQSIAAEIERNLKNSGLFSNVQATSALDLATIIVEFAARTSARCNPGGWKVVIVIKKVRGMVTVAIDVPIPRVLWVAFSSTITTDFIADLTKMLESKGAGKVTCAALSTASQ
jgi:hypothetical protein